MSAIADEEVLALIGHAARSFARDWGGPERLRKILNQPLVQNRHEWAAVVDQGWLFLLVPESKGGLNLPGCVLVKLLEELGSGLAMSPVLSGIATTAALSSIGTTKADTILSEVGSGRRICLASLPCDRYLPDIIFAKTSCNRIRAFLHDAHGVDNVVVFDTNTNQMGWLNADDHSIAFYETIDGGSIGSVALNQINSPDLIASGPAVSNALCLFQDVMALGTAAMLLGCAERALEMSLDYLKTRRQFGVPIGSFQALQHRAASLHVLLVSSRAFVFEASACFHGPNRRAACTAARARAAECALRVVKEAVQFHGAIGFADEYDLGLYFRRVVALASWYGNSSLWRRDYFNAISHRYLSANKSLIR